MAGVMFFRDQIRHINPTNVCAFHCNFCSFRHDEGEAGAYTWHADEIVEHVRADALPNVSEFHIVGGLHTSEPFEYYEDFLAALNAPTPGFISRRSPRLKLISLPR